MQFYGGHHGQLALGLVVSFSLWMCSGQKKENQHLEQKVMQKEIKKENVEISLLKYNKTFLGSFAIFVIVLHIPQWQRS